jgi:hypothetical protein
MTEAFIENRCYEAAQKIYFPAIHPREPYASSRGVKQSPFLRARSRARRPFHGTRRLGARARLCANAHLLDKFGDRVPVRENEWDNRHFWRVSNAEHLR